MDERVEALLADVLALEGEDANAIREGVRAALVDYEQLFDTLEYSFRKRHPICARMLKNAARF